MSGAALTGVRKAFLMLLLVVGVLLLVTAVQTTQAASIIVPEEVKFERCYENAVSRTVVISSMDYAGRVRVSDFWAECGVAERNPLLHNKSADDVGISITYDEEFYISEMQTYSLTVSVSAASPDIYHGMLLFEPLDAAGDIIIARAVWLFVDARAVVLQQPESPTNKTDVEIQGLAPRNTCIEIYVNAELVNVASSDEHGNLSAKVSLCEGTNEIFAKISDVNVTSNVVTVKCDTTPPEPPKLDEPPSPVYKEEIEITGTAEPYTTVKIFINGNVSGEALVVASGRFELEVTLVRGNNTITAIAVDDADNPSNESAPVFVEYKERPKIRLSANRTVLPANATALLTATIYEGDAVAALNISVKFEVSGNATLSAYEVNATNGKATTEMRATNAGGGSVTITASSPEMPEIEKGSITVTFTPSEEHVEPETQPSTNQTEPLENTMFAENATAAENATNATSNDGEESSFAASNFAAYKKSWIAAPAAVIAVVAVVIFLLMRRNIKAESEAGGDIKSTWSVLNANRNKDGTYTLKVSKDGKETTIRISKASYKKLKKQGGLDIGGHFLKLL